MKTVVVIMAVVLAATVAGCAPGGTSDGGGAGGAAVGEGATTYPLTVESCGVEATIERTPGRAVSLNQSATEIMIGLGLADRLAGTSYETDPVPDDIAETYRGIPLLTDGILKHETLLAAQPDFVYSSFASFLTTENAGDRAELHRLGVPTYLSEFDCTYHEAVKGGATFQMLFDEMEAIAKIFDVPETGRRLVTEQQAVVDRGIKIAEQHQGSPTLVWFYSTAASAATPSVAGPGGLPQTVTELVGAKNAFSDAANKWPEVSWDEIAARDPDVIVIADLTRGYPGDTAQEKIDFLKSDPLTKTMDAVVHERFIIVPGQYMDTSIRSVEAVPTVAQGLVDLGVLR